MGTICSSFVYFVQATIAYFQATIAYVDYRMTSYELDFLPF
jgi:hypothetical protein